MKILILSIGLLIAILLAACSNYQSPKTGSGQSADTIQTEAESVKWINSALGIETNILVADTLSRHEDKLFFYGTFISLPKLLGKNTEYEVLNRKIAADFDSIVKQASANPKVNKDEYHKIYFDYYLHDSIITIVITNLYAWHLSEATTAYTVYHFDFKNEKLLTTQDMFSVFGLSQVPVLSAFAEQCTMPPDHTDPLFVKAWFETIKWKDINQLKLYKNNSKQIVIIYPLPENGIEAEQIIQ
jgi:hypothetical protein